MGSSLPLRIVAAAPLMGGACLLVLACLYSLAGLFGIERGRTDNPPGAVVVFLVCAVLTVVLSRAAAAILLRRNEIQFWTRNLVESLAAAVALWLLVVMRGRGAAWYVYAAPIACSYLVGVSVAMVLRTHEKGES